MKFIPTIGLCVLFLGVSFQSEAASKRSFPLSARVRLASRDVLVPNAISYISPYSISTNDVAMAMVQPYALIDSVSPLSGSTVYGEVPLYSGLNPKNGLGVATVKIQGLASGVGISGKSPSFASVGGISPISVETSLGVVGSVAGVASDAGVSSLSGGAAISSQTEAINSAEIGSAVISKTDAIGTANAGTFISSGTEKIEVAKAGTSVGSDSEKVDKAKAGTSVGSESASVGSIRSGPAMASVESIGEAKGAKTMASVESVGEAKAGTSIEVKTESVGSAKAGSSLGAGTEAVGAASGKDGLVLATAPVGTVKTGDSLDSKTASVGTMFDGKKVEGADALKGVDTAGSLGSESATASSLSSAKRTEADVKMAPLARQMPLDDFKYWGEFASLFQESMLGQIRRDFLAAKKSGDMEKAAQLEARFWEEYKKVVARRDALMNKKRTSSR